MPFWTSLLIRASADAVWALVVVAPVAPDSRARVMSLQVVVLFIDLVVFVGLNHYRFRDVCYGLGSAMLRLCDTAAGILLLRFPARYVTSSALCSRFRSCWAKKTSFSACWRRAPRRRAPASRRS